MKHFFLIFSGLLAIGISLKSQAASQPASQITSQQSSHAVWAAGEGRLGRSALQQNLQKTMNYLADQQIKSTTVKHISQEEFRALTATLPADGEKDGADRASRSERKEYLKDLSKIQINTSTLDHFMKLNGHSGATSSAAPEVLEESWPWINNKSQNPGPRQEVANRQVFVGFDKLSGEWPCYMKAEKSIPLLGRKGTEAYDSNNFTPIAIHNNIAAVYLNNPQLQGVLPVLDRAYETSLRHYQLNGAFNFWPLQPKLLSIMPKVPEKFLSELVHRPNHFPLKGNYVNKRADVANDADDTALAYHMMHLNQKARAQFNSVSPQELKLPDRQTPAWAPNHIGDLFSPFRDENRKKHYPYNSIYGHHTETGAFLTWLSEEHHGFWSVLTDLQWDTTGIHGGLNDLDCVVNANVLTTLASYNQLETKGVEKSCQFLNEVAEGRGKDMKTCGIYYPNPYQYHYATAKAYHAGASCLEPASQNIRRKLIAEQLVDGSWPAGLTKEPVQSTLYALNALLLLKDLTDQEFVAATKGLEYLLNQATIVDNKMSWPAGVFFGGGFLIRKSLIWRSQAYSTSLGLTAISQYLQELKQRGL